MSSRSVRARLAPFAVAVVLTAWSAVPAAVPVTGAAATGYRASGVPTVSTDGFGRSPRPQVSPGSATWNPSGYYQDLPDGSYSLGWDAPPPEILPGTSYSIGLRAAADFPNGIGTRSTAEVPTLGASVTLAGPFRDTSAPGQPAGVVASAGGDVKPVPSSTTTFELIAPSQAGEYPPESEVAVRVGATDCSYIGCTGWLFTVHYPYARIAAPASGATTDVDVAVDHLEVIQVMPDPKNRIDLVAGKATAVRVFLKVNGPAPVEDVPVTVELAGLRGGNLVRPALPAMRRTLTIRPEPDRQNPEESITFKLSPDWYGAGSLGLQATVTVGAPWHETAPDDNDAVDTVEFVARRPVVWAYVPICLQVDQVTGEGVECPSDAALAGWDGLIGFARKVYPVADGGLAWYQLPGKPWPWTKSLRDAADQVALLTWLNLRMTVADAYAGAAGTPEELIAVLPAHAARQTGNNGAGGRSFGGRAAFLMDDEAGIGIAHEIGHNLGLNHVETDDFACGKTPPPFDPGPTDIGEPTVDPTTGQTVLATAKDLMSYCGGTRWISTAHYRTLLANDLRPTGQAAGQPATGSVALAVAPAGLAVPALVPLPDRLVIVRGTVRRDGTAGTIDEAFVVPAGSVAETSASTSGFACLSSAGSSGVAVRRCFEPGFEAQAGAAADAGDVGGFVAVVPLPAGAASLVLSHDGATLATLAGGGPPAIAAASHAGETWSAATEIAWSVAGADPGSSALLLYSPDDGATWLPFAPDASAGHVTVDPATLIAGSRNRFRIVVSSGLGTATADLGPITVPASVGRAPLPAASDGSAGGGAAAATSPAPSAGPAGTAGEAPGDVTAVVVIGFGALVAGIIALGALADARARRRRFPG